MLRTVLTCLATATIPASSAVAQGTTFGAISADIKAPVDLSADNLRVDQTSTRATLTGNVVIGQGDMRLGAHEVEVEYADGDRRKIARLHATGGVTLVSGDDAAEAQNAVYDVEKGVITLSGDVMMAQGKNVLSGDRMVIDLANGNMQVDGHVRSILQPGGQ